MPNDTELAARATRLATLGAESAEAIVVDSPAMFQIAADEARSIARRMAEVEEMRLSITRPLDESRKRVMALFAVPLAQLREASESLRRSMLSYQDAAARAKREAELDASRRAAVAAAAMRMCEPVVDAPPPVDDIAPPPPPAVVAAKADGISSRKTYSAAVTDLTALVMAAAKAAEAGDLSLVAFLKPDLSALNAMARATRGTMRAVPGVVITATDALTIRR